jgi:hypothetical protein
MTYFKEKFTYLSEEESVKFFKTKTDSRKNLHRIKLNSVSETLSYFFFSLKNASRDVNFKIKTKSMQPTEQLARVQEVTPLPANMHQ